MPTTSTAPAPVSWSALVASTAGLEGLGHLLVDIHLPGPVLNESRVVVQLFAPGVTLDHGQPGRYDRTLAAAQRGLPIGDSPHVRVDLIHDGPIEEGSLAVAWIESGAPDLDYDGMRAHPGDAARIASARVDGRPLTLSFGNPRVRQAAA